MYCVVVLSLWYKINTVNAGPIEVWNSMLNNPLALNVCIFLGINKILLNSVLLIGLIFCLLLFIGRHKNVYCVVEISAWILEVTCCEFSSKFTPLHLTVWTVCSKWEATTSSNFMSVIVREQKGLRKRDYLGKCPGPLNKFPRNWFLHDMSSWEHHDAFHVSNHWLHMVQMVKCKGVNFEENSLQATSFKLLSQLHRKKITWISSYGLLHSMKWQYLFSQCPP